VTFGDRGVTLTPELGAEAHGVGRAGDDRVGEEAATLFTGTRHTHFEGLETAGRHGAGARWRCARLFHEQFHVVYESRQSLFVEVAGHELVTEFAQQGGRAGALLVEAHRAPT
jgi:hypothetical protein